MDTKLELSNAEIAAYAVYKLGGSEKKIHTEHIAIECYELARDRFGWKLPQFRKYPDKQRTREALKDAQYFKGGKLITGRGGTAASGQETDGWMLTPFGARWVLKNQNRIELLLKISNKLAIRLDVQRIINWFEQENCYVKYIRDGSLDNVSEYEFKDMLLCRPDARPEVITREFSRIRTKAEIAQVPSILTFLKACEEKFKDLMEEK